MKMDIINTFSAALILLTVIKSLIIGNAHGLSNCADHRTSIPGQPHRYIEMVHMKPITKLCAPGTHFNQTTCQCSILLLQTGSGNDGGVGVIHSDPMEGLLGPGGLHPDIAGLPTEVLYQMLQEHQRNPLTQFMHNPLPPTNPPSSINNDPHWIDFNLPKSGAQARFDKQHGTLNIKVPVNESINHSQHFSSFHNLNSRQMDHITSQANNPDLLSQLEQTHFQSTVSPFVEGFQGMFDFLRPTNTNNDFNTGLLFDQVTHPGDFMHNRRTQFSAGFLPRINNIQSTLAVPLRNFESSTGPSSFSEFDRIAGLLTTTTSSPLVSFPMESWTKQKEPKSNVGQKEIVQPLVNIVSSKDFGDKSSQNNVQDKHSDTMILVPPPPQVTSHADLFPKSTIITSPTFNRAELKTRLPPKPAPRPNGIIVTMPAEITTPETITETTRATTTTMRTTTPATTTTTTSTTTTTRATTTVKPTMTTQQDKVISKDVTSSSKQNQQQSEPSDSLDELIKQDKPITTRDILKHLRRKLRKQGVPKEQITVPLLKRMIRKDKRLLKLIRRSRKFRKAKKEENKDKKNNTETKKVLPTIRAPERTTKAPTTIPPAATKTLVTNTDGRRDVKVKTKMKRPVVTTTIRTTRRPTTIAPPTTAKIPTKKVVHENKIDSVKVLPTKRTTMKTTTTSPVITTDGGIQGNIRRKSSKKIPRIIFIKLKDDENINEKLKSKPSIVDNKDSKIRKSFEGDPMSNIEPLQPTRLSNVANIDKANQNDIKRYNVTFSTDDSAGPIKIADDNRRQSTSHKTKLNAETPLSINDTSAVFPKNEVLPTLVEAFPPIPPSPPPQFIEDLTRTIKPKVTDNVVRISKPFKDIGEIQNLGSDQKLINNYTEPTELHIGKSKASNSNGANVNSTKSVDVFVVPLPVIKTAESTTVTQNLQSDVTTINEVTITVPPPKISIKTERPTETQSQTFDPQVLPPFPFLPLVNPNILPPHIFDKANTLQQNSSDIKSLEANSTFVSNSSIDSISGTHGIDTKTVHQKRVKGSIKSWRRSKPPNSARLARVFQSKKIGSTSSKSQSGGSASIPASLFADMTKVLARLEKKTNKNTIPDKAPSFNSNQASLREQFRNLKKMRDSSFPSLKSNLGFEKSHTSGSQMENVGVSQTKSFQKQTLGSSATMAAVNKLDKQISDLLTIMKKEKMSSSSNPPKNKATETKQKTSQAIVSNPVQSSPKRDSSSGAVDMSPVLQHLGIGRQENKPSVTSSVSKPTSSSPDVSALLKQIMGGSRQTGTSSIQNNSGSTAGGTTPDISATIKAIIGGQTLDSRITPSQIASMSPNAIKSAISQLVTTLSAPGSGVDVSALISKLGVGSQPQPTSSVSSLIGSNTGGPNIMSLLGGSGLGQDTQSSMPFNLGSLTGGLDMQRMISNMMQNEGPGDTAEMMNMMQGGFMPGGGNIGGSLDLFGGGGMRWR